MHRLWAAPDTPVALLAAIIRLTLGATRAHRRVVSQPNAPLRGPEAAMEYAILNEMLYHVGLGFSASAASVPSNLVRALAADFLRKAFASSSADFTILSGGM